MDERMGTPKDEDKTRERSWRGESPSNYPNLTVPPVS